MDPTPNIKTPNIKVGGTHGEVPAGLGRSFSVWPPPNRICPFPVVRLSGDYYVSVGDRTRQPFGSAYGSHPTE
jgi:hypothetical protein